MRSENECRRDVANTSQDKTNTGQPFMKLGHNLGTRATLVGKLEKRNSSFNQQNSPPASRFKQWDGGISSTVTPGGAGEAYLAQKPCREVAKHDGIVGLLIVDGQDT